MGKLLAQSEYKGGKQAMGRSALTNISVTGSD